MRETTCIARTYSLRSLLLLVAVLGFVFRLWSDWRAQNAAVCELEHLGAGFVSVPGNSHYWILLLDEWKGTDADLWRLRYLRSKITHVGLQNKRISDKVVGNFACLHRVRYISIIDCSITDNGIYELAGLPELETMEVIGVSIRQATRERLSQRPKPVELRVE